MPYFYDTLRDWARRTTSGFAELGWQNTRPDAPELVQPCSRAYRLRQWPDLPSGCKTAPIYRALSMMSHRPVTRHWLEKRCELGSRGTARLLRLLAKAKALEVTELAA